MVSNVLPLRLVVHAGMAQSELIHQVAAEVAGLLAHQRYRGEDLHRDLGLSGDLGTSFGLVVNIQSFDYDLKFAGNATAVHNVASAMLGDLSLLVLDRRDHSEIGVSWRAAGGVCSPNALNAHQERFVTLVEAMAVADPHQPIGRIDILGPDDVASTGGLQRHRPGRPRHHPAGVVRGSRCGAPPTTPRWSSRTPPSPTPSSTPGPTAWPGCCIERGVGPRVRGPGRAPLAGDVVAMLAVVRAGAAYLPLDPDYPPALAPLLDDARPCVPDHHRRDAAARHRGGAGDRPGPPRHVDALGATATPSHDTAGSPLLARHPAYVIYTSGSTGRPRASLSTHRTWSTLASTHASDRGHHRVVLSTRRRRSTPPPTSCGCRCCAGGRVVVRRPRTAGRRGRGSSPENGITGLSLTAGLFRLAAEDPLLRRLRRGWSVGGEAFPAEAVRRVRRPARGLTVIDGYGPTETTTFATSNRPGPPRPAPVPIGRPIDNTRVYVLDAGLQPVPAGRGGRAVRRRPRPGPRLPPGPD